MAAVFCPMSTEMEARFLLAGEEFEYRSVLCRVLVKPITRGEKTYVHTTAILPSGETKGLSLVLPSRLSVVVEGRYLEAVSIA